ncbi:MAG: hypothetical protein FJY37_18635 [Betaproteobacteria bacterium]|nr:hypothetical protein [Betaproteobacteria bacterium]
MLLEAMIAILIFSFGILAVVGMQARAMQDMGQAKYRSDAAFLANQLVADIWTNAKNVADYQWAGGGGTTPPSLSNWVSQVNEMLPGSDVHTPTVAYDAASQQVTITLRWLTPAEAGENPSMGPHSFVAVTYINTNS